MAINFKNAAIEKTTLSDLMRGRTKKATKEGTHHISDFDIVPSSNGEPYAICAVSDTEFINGGKVLTDMFIEFVAAYDGNISQCREDFRNQGGLNIKATMGKTRDGAHSLLKIEVIE